MLRPLTTFITLFFLLLTPCAQAQKQNYKDYRALIDLVDHRVDEVLRKRKFNHQAQKDIEKWNREAGYWIDQQSNKSAALSRAKKRSGNYATMTDGQLQSEIQNLEAELSEIRQPSRGRMVGGERYKSLNAVYDEVTAKTKELVALQQKDYDLYQELIKLDAQRDEYAKEAEKKSGWVVHDNLKVLKMMEAAYEKGVAQVNDPNLWCEQHLIMNEHMGFDPGPIICKDRKLAMIDLTMRYRAEMIRQGIPYDPELMERKIRDMRDESSRIKKFMREEEIPNLEQAIKFAKKKHNEASNPPIELAGCWLIVDPSGKDNARLSVKKRWDGVYEGSITSYGWIGLPNGHTLFLLKRTNYNTFDGTEFSIMNSKRTQTPLRVIVDRQRRSGTYRTTDDLLRLSPCD